MDPFQNLRKHKAQIEKKIGYSFKKEDLFYLIFVHRSFYNENQDCMSGHNERLEFLGDSVLGLIVANLLFQLLPDHPEGKLSYLHSNLVNAEYCSQYMSMLKIEKYLLLGKGQAKVEGRGAMTILADAFEALIGAIYLDGGLTQANEFFQNHFKKIVLKTIEKPSLNYKALLQDYCQKKYRKPPCYQVIEEIGPSHAKIFIIEAIVSKKITGKGKGSTKKQAEQMAAEAVLKKLKEIE